MSKKLLLALFIAFPLVSKSELIETTGYGSGDNLEQAIIVAKVDAILNAGGRTYVESEANNEKLVHDWGKSANDAYLVSYEVTEQGESFGGTYVRIGAKVSKSAYVSPKDEVQVFSCEGAGSDKHEATIVAMSNAILDSGARINAAVEYESENVIKDQALIDASGIILKCQVESVSEDSKRVKTKCSVSKDNSKAKSMQSKKISAKGMGSTRADAEAVARRNLVLDYGSLFSVHCIYMDGVLKEIHTKRERDAFISDFTVENVNCVSGITTVECNALLSDTARGGAAATRVSGNGVGKDFVDVYKSAICDAVIKYGAKASAMATYEWGKEVGGAASYLGTCTCLGEEVSSLTNQNGMCYMTVVLFTSPNLPYVPADIDKHILAKGYGRDKQAAIEDAKQRAVDMVFGCLYEAEVKEQNGLLVSSSHSARHSEKGYVDKYEIQSEDDNMGEVIITIDAVVKNHDGDPSIFERIWHVICWILTSIFKLIWWLLKLIWWILKALWMAICWIIHLFE